MRYISTMEINTNITEQIERAEAAYTTFAKSVPDSRWGEEEEAELGRRAETLQALYDEANTPEFDRVVL